MEHGTLLGELQICSKMSFYKLFGLRRLFQWGVLVGLPSRQVGKGGGPSISIESRKVLIPDMAACIWHN